MLFCVVKSSFASSRVTTSCGKTITTAGLEYFDGNMNDYCSYLQDLNKAVCGEEGRVSFVIE